MKLFFNFITLIVILCPSFAMAKDFSNRFANCEPYKETVIEILEEHNVPNYFYFLMVAESTCNHNTSPKGAKGFWQMMPYTQQYYGCDDHTDLVCQTHAAARYLARLLALFKGDLSDVVRGYNQGGTNYLRNGPTAQSDALAWTVRRMHKQYQTWNPECHKF